MTSAATQLKPQTPAIPVLSTSHLLSIADLSATELRQIIALARESKRDPSILAGSLAGTSTIMLFEKPSLRTRVSFEVGIARLGGHAMYFDHSKEPIGKREPVKDYAMNLERWVDCVIARVNDHDVLTGLAQYGSVPVINALSDVEHPCQAIADVMTLEEHIGDLHGARLAYIGDGNNVCHSLILACAKLGINMTVITPAGFEPQFEVIRAAQPDAIVSGATLKITNDVRAIESHDAVYTDKWVSMGQDHQQALRDGAFDEYQVSSELMQLASAGSHETLFMHCLPAVRGEEVTTDVIDGKHSIVYDQAENRMHAQMALLAAIIPSSDKNRRVAPTHISAT